MARKMMSKEVTKTVVKLAVLELVDGTPTINDFWVTFLLKKHRRN